MVSIREACSNIRGPPHVLRIVYCDHFPSGDTRRVMSVDRRGFIIVLWAREMTSVQAVIANYISIPTNVLTINADDRIRSFGQELARVQVWHFLHPYPS